MGQVGAEVGGVEGVVCGGCWWGLLVLDVCCWLDEVI